MDYKVVIDDAVKLRELQKKQEEYDEFERKVDEIKKLLDQLLNDKKEENEYVPVYNVQGKVAGFYVNGIDNV